MQLHGDRTSATVHCTHTLIRDPGSTGVSAAYDCIQLWSSSQQSRFQVACSGSQHTAGGLADRSLEGLFIRGSHGDEEFQRTGHDLESGGDDFTLQELSPGAAPNP